MINKMLVVFCTLFASIASGEEIPMTCTFDKFFFGSERNAFKFHKNLILQDQAFHRVNGNWIDFCSNQRIVVPLKIGDKSARCRFRKGPDGIVDIIADFETKQMIFTLSHSESLEKIWDKWTVNCD
ncbi:hypothetical protein OAL97_02185 [Paracoccaceae bacterium]|jgi:hypothetical protein|nr:hypothetical protein [Paracoccaceae bacterium]